MAKAESKNSGFIFLHRSIREHWIWKDPVKFQWWVDVLMECNHSDRKMSIGYDLIECRRGQSINSLLTWAKLWRVDVSTVRRFLKLLENDSMIVTENLQKTTRLTVCNYDTYNSITAGKTIDRAIPTQFARNSDAIQTKNEIITNKEEYSPDQIKDFEKFQKWIIENAKTVSEMKEPFTIKQFLEIKKNTPVAKISAMLRDMHNWEPLLKKNKSAYLTFLKWIGREEKENPKPEAESIPKRLQSLAHD